MRILFHHRTTEIDMSGTAAELHHLSELVAAGEGVLTGDDVPGLASLTSLRVRTVPGSAVIVSVREEARSLSVAGDRERLSILAANLSGMAEMEDGRHLHVDWFPDHPYLAAGSMSLVVNSPHGGMPA